MDEKKNSDENLYDPNTTMSTAATTPTDHASQSQNSNLGFLTNHTNDLNQKRLGSPCSPEAHESGIDSTINFFELNHVPVALSDNSLEHESTPQGSQDSLEVQCDSSPKTTTHSLLPIQFVELRDQGLNGEIGGESKSSNTVEGKNRKPSTKKKHSEETGHNVVNGEINDGGNDETTGQSLPHEQIFWKRTSKYRGVTRGHINRYETFLWDNSDPQAKPRTVYVGGFAEEKMAARAYDLAALKLSGVSAQTNFPLSEYEKDLEEMKNMTKKEYLVTLRRKSKGFSKGVSVYRGVSRNPDCKKWQARLGKGKETKGIYLGTFESEEEAAKAYDVAAIRVRGMKAITNFNTREYDVKNILESAKLPIGQGASKFLKENSVDDVLVKKRKTRKLPILNPELNSLSSCQENPQLQSSAEEQNNQNQLNCDDISDGIENYFPVLCHQIQNPDEFQTNPSSNANSLQEHLAMMENGENQKFIKHVLHEYPSSSLIKAYQNHPSSSLLQDHQNDFQTNPSVLNLLTGDGNGNAFEINGDLSGKSKRRVSSDEVLEGYTTLLTETNENLASDFFQEMQQIPPCENFLQLLGQKNQDSLFDLNDRDDHQKPHQNLSFQANPCLLRGLTEIDFWENSKSTYDGELSSSGILKGNSSKESFSSKRLGEAKDGGLFKDVEDDDLPPFFQMVGDGLDDEL